MRQEQILFKKAIARVNLFLKFSGIYINYDDADRTLSQRLRRRWFYCVNFVWLNTDTLSWFSIIHALSIQEITYMVPCITLCTLGSFKSYSFMNYHHHVIDLLKTLEDLQSITETSHEVEVDMKKKYLPFLYLTNNMLLTTGIIGIAMFFVGPGLLMIQDYMATHKIILALPFLLWYPFDAYNIKFWPFAFLHQFWSAWACVFFVYGADIFYYTSCAFLHLQFHSLRLDMKHVARRLQEEGRLGLIPLLQRHLKLVRCINLLEAIYGKSTLYNAISSSLIICVTGFNITAIDDLLLMLPFTPFLALGSLQIYLFCYYGDLLMQDSLEISEAVYDTEWYNLHSTDMKYCLFMLMRAQKPCKITAYGFLDINMRAFTRILSSAWSYFTLLKTMYGQKK